MITFAAIMKVLFEDNHLIAVNKPNNVLVQGDETGDETLADQVKQYIKEKYEKPGDVYLGIIHRLDRPVSGVTIFARTSKALERMNKIFAEREVKKTYWAVVGRRPENLYGHLTHFILKDSAKNVVKAYDTMSNRAKGAKQADLDYAFC
jgi:23S rRNA pseudouridine1911/1915/1917 synthase